MEPPDQTIPTQSQLTVIVGRDGGRVLSKKLGDCFQNVECRAGKENGRMCATRGALLQFIGRINDRARSVAGVNFNASRTASIIGGGIADLDFAAVDAPNVAYLFTNAWGARQ